MITNHAPNDGATEEQSIVSGEGTAILPCVPLDLVSDDLGSPAAKMNDLRPVKISGRPQGTTMSQLIGTVNSKGFTPLLRRHVLLGLGGRLRQLSVEVCEHRDVRQRGRLCDGVLF